MESPRRDLARKLAIAYSAELAAAIAYRGHGRSVRAREERERIRQIERDELVHRERVGEMLAALGGAPSRVREACMTLIGLLIAASCFVGGWLLPMYGAGRIERRNICEYEEAARLALLGGLPAFANELLAMAEVEWDHEEYFHDQVRRHVLHRLVGSWPAPPPRSAIRASFAEFRERLAPPHGAAGAPIEPPTVTAIVAS